MANPRNKSLAGYDIPVTLWIGTARGIAAWGTIS